jgi:hypothetical protein
LPTKLTANSLWTDSGGKWASAFWQLAFPNKMAVPIMPDWWSKKSHDADLSPLVLRAFPSGRRTTFVVTMRAKAKSI